MPNIIGEQIPEYVAKQINKRQKVHGSGTDGTSRTPEQISYLNSKTAWVKLASGVSLDDKRIQDEKLRGGVDAVPNSTLAKRYVLFNGISRIENNQLLQRGTSTNPLQDNVTNYYTGTYNVNAVGESSEFGLVPMPGIESAEIKCLNRGSIKRATVKIKCYSPEQFQILDLLYMRIGYTMLLEWGNSLYLSNSEDGTNELQEMGFTLVEDPDGFFSDNVKTYYDMLPRIKGYRESKSGNYDALISRVVNFSWQFAQDGSYDITLELISMGDVIESLKTNITPDSDIIKFIDDTYSTTTSTETTPSEITSPSSNIISSYLYYQYMLNEDRTNWSTEKIFIEIEGTPTQVGHFVKPPQGSSPVVLSSSFTEISQEVKDVACIEYTNALAEDDYNMGFYMRFGHLLEFIRERVIPNVIVDDSPKEKIIEISYGMYDSLMYNFPYQVSLDPQTCIVSNLDEPVKTKHFFHQLRHWKSEKHPGAALTMNIYLHHVFIDKCLRENTDDKGKVSLFDFLDAICTGLNKALGGVNNLEPVIDEDTNMISIIDSNYYSYQSPKYGLELYGYNNDFDSSTTVRNFTLKTDITPEFASMASISSTAGGYVKGVENTMFSKWNRGLLDRLQPKLSTYVGSQSTDSIDEVKQAYLKKFWWGKYSAFGLKDQSLELDPKIIENNVAIVSEFYKAAQSSLYTIYDGKYVSPTNGFIPINLGLTMDGIGGIKIYNELNVATKFLPSRYPDNLHFIVKGVNHKLTNSDWETSVETVSISNSGEENIDYNKIRDGVNKILNETNENIINSSPIPTSLIFNQLNQINIVTSNNQ